MYHVMVVPLAGRKFDLCAGYKLQLTAHRLFAPGVSILGSQHKVVMQEFFCFGCVMKVKT
jgi:hypothetical protein